MAIKTTEQLIEFLDAEFKAIHSGQKGLPFSFDEDKAYEIEKSAGMMGAFLGADKLAQVSYYHDIRQQVWDYQVEHNVSGLVIQSIEVGGKSIRFPVLDDQLIMVEGDKDILVAAKDRVVDFFADFCKINLVYISHAIYSKDGGEWSMETTLEFILSFARDMEWASLSSLSEGFGSGICLQLGYGCPKDAQYVHSKDSDNWFFDATTATRWIDPRTIQTAEVVKLGFDDIRKMRKDKELE